MKPGFPLPVAILLFTAAVAIAFMLAAAITSPALTL